MTEQETKELYELYFNQFWSISKLIRHFKRKYTHLEIRTEIKRILASR